MWIECPYRSVIIATGCIAAACMMIALGMSLIGAFI